jgi:predicted MFS family arabinose efflux permease
MPVPNQGSSVNQRTSVTMGGYITLMLAHCVGLVDLIALPLWVGVLIERYHFDPQQAGGVITLFLIGVMVASIVIAPMFSRMNVKMLTPVGFLLAGILFGACASVRAFGSILVLHFLSGLCIGTSLSLTHGTMGRTPNPHRLFGISMASMGFFGLVFLITAGFVLKSNLPGALFYLFVCIMLIGVVATTIAFPVLTNIGAGSKVKREHPPIPKVVWLGIAGVVCINLSNAMVFSFIERIGVARGISQGEVVALLAIVGLVNVAAAMIAATFERRFNPRAVLFIGPVLQGICAAGVTLSSSVPAYFAFGLFFVPSMVFTHTFIFGILAKLDPSGRAVAANPAMVMLGAAVGPIVSGTLTKVIGFHGIGYAVLIVECVAVSVLAVLALAAVRLRNTPASLQVVSV